MRALYPLIVAAVLTGACASTRAPAPGAEGHSPAPSAGRTTAPAGPSEGALRHVAREGALAAESAEAAPAERRAFDPDQVHHRSGRRQSHLSPYFHPEAMGVALEAGETVELDPDWMVAHFIDVGQGDAILLELPCGAVLIDTGGEDTDEVNGAEQLGAYLNTFFARRTDLSRTLDLVVLSHPHRDHTLGVTALIGSIPGVASVAVRNVVDNSIDDGRHSGLEGQNALRDFAADTNARYQAIRNRDIEFLDGLTSEVIDPLACPGVDPVIRAVWGRDSDEWSSNGNNHSVVLRVDFGEASFLFVGDSQHEALKGMLDSYAEDLSILDVDVLKVGHHGSHNATSLEFLAAVTPEIAVIQAGDPTRSQAQFSAFSFAHPNQRAIASLTDAEHGVSASRPPKLVDIGVKGRNPSTGAPPELTTVTLDRAVYATSWDGTIVVEAKKDGTLRVITSR